ncbi:hypothetical protein E3P99_00378 [Wallemia hederae]|uniref:Uncharacterized protein n=1 Tax=Wallemia hederae TaxID=1540922 RepID=A0A4V4LUC9_9BASI|nr:hypothetical protein E3P99_00378 [Wallemia hederae]
MIIAARRVVASGKCTEFNAIRRSTPRNLRNYSIQPPLKPSADEEEVLLLQRPARFSPKILWACVGTLSLYAVVCAEACYHYEAFKPKREDGDDNENKEAEEVQTAYWKRVLASAAVATIGLGAGGLLLFNSSREIIRLSHLPKSDLLRLHTSLNLPMSFSRGKKYAKLGQGVYVDAKTVSLREPKQSGQRRTLSAVPLSLETPRLPLGIDRRFPWRVNVVPPQKEEGFYINNAAFLHVFKNQWKNLVGR